MIADQSVALRLYHAEVVRVIRGVCRLLRREDSWERDFFALNQLGYPVSPFDKDAVRFSWRGAVARCSPTGRYGAALGNSIAAAAGAYLEPGMDELPADHTHADLLAFLQRKALACQWELVHFAKD